MGAGVVASATVVALAGGMLPGTLASPALAAAAVTTGATPAAAAPATTQVRSLDVPGTSGAFARGGGAVVARLEPTETQVYGMVGVTWEPATAAQDTVVWVRTRNGDTWGPWTHLGGCTCPACRGSRPEDSDNKVRVGTAPTWIGSADGVAVRVISRSGSVPTDVSVELIEPDRSPLAPGTAVRASADTGAAAQRLAAGFPAMPNVVTRQEWGAAPGLVEPCDAPKYGSAARSVAVHHTVNSNSYSASETPALMRSILAYHTQSQGWCDLGYNFVVDRYGRIFEGRRGGMRLPVRGAHAGDYNTDTVGISMLGDFDVAPLTRRLKRSMVRLIGWRLGTSYVPAQGTAIVPGGRVARIFAHRDVMPTECPGRYGYAFLPRLRKRTTAYTSRYDSPIRARAKELGSRVTGPVFQGERFARGGSWTRFGKGAMFSKNGLGTHWLERTTFKGYRRAGGVYGVLGYPRSGQRSTAVRGVSVIRFEGGSIYRVSTRNAYLVRGRILIRYRKLGGVDGRLGVPTSTTTRTGPREQVTFQHGRIVHNTASRKIWVFLS